MIRRYWWGRGYAAIGSAFWLVLSRDRILV
jgi:hypothetical protein